MGHNVQDQICPIGIRKVVENQVLTRALANFHGTNKLYNSLNLLLK